MAFRASNSIPESAYEQAKALAVQVKSLADNRAARWASGSDAVEVSAAIDRAVAMRDRLNAIASTPGIAAYARSQEDDDLYDVVAEFQALVAALETVIAECVNALPTSSPGNFVELYSIDTVGSKTVNPLSSADLAAAVTALQALSNQVV